MSIDRSTSVSLARNTRSARPAPNCKSLSASSVLLMSGQRRFCSVLAIGWNAEMEIEVVESTRRVKTAQLTVTPVGVRVTLPASASKEEKDRLVEILVRKHKKSLRSNDVDLMARARKLATEYGFELPVEIKWVDNQNHRWGSCTPSTRVIRISSSMNTFPLWVIDSVVAHELAHLTHRRHNAAFWRLANRYPLMERARGFLLAAQIHGLGSSTESHTSDSPDEDEIDDVIDADLVDDLTHGETEIITLPFGEYDAVNGEVWIRT